MHLLRETHNKKCPSETTLNIEKQWYDVCKNITWTTDTIILKSEVHNTDWQEMQTLSLKKKKFYNM